MKVVFGCYIHNFHKDYCFNIADEVERRGGTAIFAKSGSDRYTDADFTIQPDEAYVRHGGKGVWINHAFPVVPQNGFYLKEKFRKKLRENSDYIFTFSSDWADWHKRFGLPTYVVGMPKLDGLFNTNRKKNTIFYAPTGSWKKDVTSVGMVDVISLKKYGRVIYNQHPADEKNDVKTSQALSEASIVISDYSSIGIEAIALNVPTILIDNEKWDNVAADHISHLARNAAIRVKTQKELETAIEVYQNNPDYLLKERLMYSNKLCEYQGKAASRMVDVLEELKQNEV